MNPEEFVLERFEADETSQLGDIVSRGAQAVCSLLADGVERAMEQFNRAI